MLTTGREEGGTGVHGAAGGDLSPSRSVPSAAPSLEWSVFGLALGLAAPTDHSFPEPGETLSATLVFCLVSVYLHCCPSCLHMAARESVYCTCPGNDDSKQSTSDIVSPP